MAINNNDNGLYKNIEAALEEAVITMYEVPYIDGDNISTRNETFPLIPSPTNVKAKMVSFENPKKPTFQKSYGTGTVDLTDGMRKIVEVISKEVLNYIVQNAEVAAKKRYDKLEQDYNDLYAATQEVVALVTTALAVNTAAVAADLTGTVKPYVTHVEMAAFIAPLLGAGGPIVTPITTRQSETTEKLINNNELIYGIPVDIK